MRLLLFAIAGLLLVPSIYLFYQRHIRKPRPWLFRGFLIDWGAWLFLFLSGWAAFAGLLATPSDSGASFLDAARKYLCWLPFVLFFSSAAAMRDFTIRFRARERYRRGERLPLPFDDPDDYDVRD